jgi:hypothetical protein
VQKGGIIARQTLGFGMMYSGKLVGVNSRGRVTTEHIIGTDENLCDDYRVVARDQGLSSLSV